MINKIKLVLVVIVFIFVLTNSTLRRLLNNITGTYTAVKRAIAVLIALSALWAQLKASSDKIENESDSLNKLKKKRRVTESMKKRVAARQQWKCGLCGQLLDETYEIDHIIPLCKNGTNDMSNLMALDPICHRKKTLEDGII